MRPALSSARGLAVSLLRRPNALWPSLVVVQFIVLALLVWRSPGCERRETSSMTGRVTDRGPRPGRIFYNRVPKCGSSTLTDMMRIMASVNNFTFGESGRYMMFVANESEQRAIARRALRLPTPVIFERHLHFIDFKRFGLESPLYINLVREPLDRLVSWYYYRRFQPGHIRVMSNENRARTYDDCVLGNFSECVDPLGMEPGRGYFKIIPFFCGQDAFCRVPGDDSLAQAIRNVKRHFAVVGVMEEYEQLIDVLELTFPSYFRGMTEIYKAVGSRIHTKYITTNRLVPSRNVQQIMYGKLSHETQFYIFIRKRFRRYAYMLRSKKVGSIA